MGIRKYDMKIKKFDNSIHTRKFSSDIVSYLVVGNSIFAEAEEGFLNFQGRICSLITYFGLIIIEKRPLSRISSHVSSLVYLMHDII